MISYMTWMELTDKKKYELAVVMYEKIWNAINENGADITDLKRRLDSADNNAHQH